MNVTAKDIFDQRAANLRHAARIAEGKAEYYKLSDKDPSEGMRKCEIALEVARAIRAQASPQGEEPEFCPDCRGKKGDLLCMGSDDCPSDEYSCENWEPYCCHCGKEYAMGQI